MTSNDLSNALSFLSRLYVGKTEEDKFMRTLSALRKERDRLSAKKLAEKTR